MTKVKSKKTPRIVYFFIFLILILGSGYFFVVESDSASWSMQKLQIFSGQQSPQLSKELKTTVKISIADNEGDRAKGLMFVKHLAEDQGMLFVFPDEQPRSFWMKNTYIPLDMLYIDKNFKIVAITKNAKPLSVIPLPFSSPSKFVLEVNGGFCEKHKIGEGDVIEVAGELREGN